MRTDRSEVVDIGRLLREAASAFAPPSDLKSAVRQHVLPRSPGAGICEVGVRRLQAVWGTRLGRAASITVSASIVVAVVLLIMWPAGGFNTFAASVARAEEATRTSVRSYKMTTKRIAADGTETFSYAWYERPNRYRVEFVGRSVRIDDGTRNVAFNPVTRVLFYTRASKRPDVSALPILALDVIRKETEAGRMQTTGPVDEEIAGEPCDRYDVWMPERRAGPNQTPEPIRARVWFRKADGLFVGMERRGLEIQISDHTRVEYNVEVPDDLFVIPDDLKGLPSDDRPDTR